MATQEPLSAADIIARVNRAGRRLELLLIGTGAYGTLVSVACIVLLVTR